MVIIGKTETLMQLARTDASPSGKQLYALLLQVDEAFNPFNSTTNPKKSNQDSDSSEDDSSSDEERDAARDDAARIAALTQKLRKNATALVRKQRYREAAAVFLLCPTAAMVKSALNLLTVQYNQPFLAHLVARCLEYRIYGHGEISRKFFLPAVLNCSCDWLSACSTSLISLKACCLLFIEFYIHDMPSI